MHPSIAMALKDLRLLWRDRAALFFTVVFPVVFATVFGLIYSGMGGTTSAIRVAFVDQAQSPASMGLVDSLGGQSAIELVPVGSADEGRELVRQGRRSACLVIPPEFRDLPSAILRGSPASVELAIDPSRVQERAMIEGLVAQAAYAQLSAGFQDAESIRTFTADARAQLESGSNLNFLQRAAALVVLSDIEAMADQMDQGAAADGGDGGGAQGGGAAASFEPIRVAVTEVTGRRADWHASAFSITFAQGVVWALIGCAASFSMSLVIERSGGTLLRLRAAPLRPMHVVVGKGAACVVTTLVAASLLIGLGMGVFGLRIGQPVMLAAALAASAVAFVGIMMVLAVAGKTPRAAGPLGYAILLTMAILGGGMMPHFMMPAWMQRVGMLSPVKWTVVAVENAVFRGASWGEQAMPLAVLVGIGAVGMAVGGAVFARSAE